MHDEDPSKSGPEHSRNLDLSNFAKLHMHKGEVAERGMTTCSTRNGLDPTGMFATRPMGLCLCVFRPTVSVRIWFAAKHLHFKGRTIKEGACVCVSICV